MAQYNTKAQKIIVFIFATPIYIMLAVQLIKVFKHFNPSPILY